MVKLICLSLLLVLCNSQLDMELEELENGIENKPQAPLNYVLGETGTRKCPEKMVEIRNAGECRLALHTLKIKLASEKEFKNGKLCYKAGNDLGFQNGHNGNGAKLICRPKSHIPLYSLGEEGTGTCPENTMAIYGTDCKIALNSLKIKFAPGDNKFFVGRKCYKSGSNLGYQNGQHGSKAKLVCKTIVDFVLGEAGMSKCPFGFQFIHLKEECKVGLDELGIENIGTLQSKKLCYVDFTGKGLQNGLHGSKAKLVCEAIPLYKMKINVPETCKNPDNNFIKGFKLAMPSPKFLNGQMKRIDGAFRNPTFCVKLCQGLRECAGVLFAANGMCLHYLGTVHLDLRKNQPIVEGKMENVMYTKCKPVTCQDISNHFGAEKKFLFGYEWGCTPGQWQNYFRMKSCKTKPESSSNQGCRNTEEMEEELAFAEEMEEGLAFAEEMEQGLEFTEDIELVEDIEVGQGSEPTSSFEWNLAVFFMASFSFTIGYYYNSKKSSQQVVNYVEMA